MNSAFEAVSKNIETAAGWQQKYRQIMLLGKQLPVMPEVLKVDDALVKGCESKVWLYIDFDHTENSLVLAGDSDTR
ncbi:MAG: SufE family protein, partial [Photobacterium aquimaris]|nr:SufE family protein [Photobacterium aquimaris]